MEDKIVVWFFMELKGATVDIGSDTFVYDTAVDAFKLNKEDRRKVW